MIDRSRRTLILVLLSIGFVFACYVVGVYSSWRKGRSIPLMQPPALGPLVKSEDIGKSDGEQNDEQRLPIVPQTFESIDFKNYSYGYYRAWSGKRMKLTLKDGEHWYEYPDLDRGWFSFADVFYTDVTADRTPEAVVLLSHVQCGGGSCDGGAALIYIYAVRKGKLKKLWRYETGSRAYGCGLKSFNVQGKQIVLEAFGRCPHSAGSYHGPAKFVVEDMTRSEFRFNGRRFTRRRLEFISASATDVKNYKPEIRIN